MKSVIKTAKTVDEAVKLALDEFKTSIENVEIEVLEEPKNGIFGIGSRDATVKITLTYNPIEIAETFLRKVISKMQLSANPDVSIDGDTMYVDIKDISSEDKGILIGKRGNTLDSIQYLLSLTVNRGNNIYFKIIIDVEEYRKKREETLIKLANKMADKVKKSRKNIKLEPMNPYERRIIHAALQGFKGISTYSEGNEPYRRVLITLKREH